MDARASGCQIICTDSGGTREIAGKDAIVLEEDEWDFEPLDLYNAPKINFGKKVDSLPNKDYIIGMDDVFKRYEAFIK